MEHSQRTPSCPLSPLEDRFEVIKEIGDGSFGSVVLARVRGAGASVARRGTMVAIKTMKKTYDSFAPCLELREVIFLRTLPTHAHLVPALDIFLDPFSKKLHICMEIMDGNLYQFLKARDHKPMDSKSVKSILFQILSGLDHIHAHDFFHRDIKPENILVSTSAPQDSSSAFSRYSNLVTPPSTPPVYYVKIADFGLARETRSRSPYTTYVSTRWYRAPEVLLRAGEYSAPVDIWAIGAMAVEIANLKPLFPGGNEVDQVWRICEIMGSPGNWCNKSGARVGGGDWREGTRLAQKLGFSFPKMAPHSMDTILQAPQWPTALSGFVTWCLMWDPKNRPTSKQALEHEFFLDAVDPLRPKSSTTRLLGRKHSEMNFKLSKEANDSQASSSKSSWFRRSLIARENAPVVQLHDPNPKPIRSATMVDVDPSSASTAKPVASKRATWTHGLSPAGGAPMPILPSIRPVSPLSNAVTAQASSRIAHNGETRTEAAQLRTDEKSKKIGRQLSLNSHGNHYSDAHRLEAERSWNANSGFMSPPNGQRESFFSHLRKRARRFSSRHGVASPPGEDIDNSPSTGPWSPRSSMLVDKVIPEAEPNHDFTDLDKALQSVRYSLDPTTPTDVAKFSTIEVSNMTNLKRHHSLNMSNPSKSTENIVSTTAPISSRTRRAVQMPTHSVHRYETPEEEDEFLDEAVNTAHHAANRLEQHSNAEDQKPRAVLTQKDNNRQSGPYVSADLASSNPYPTPSPSAKRNTIHFGSDLATPARPLLVKKAQSENQDVNSQWPTPPYEDNEWAAAAAASIFAAGSVYR